ncbi:MAG: MFS transporter, partial [Oscillospiraceae bacterium]|nr:MFS transporter [Oscillospiraceae bacterium]
MKRDPNSLIAVIAVLLVGILCQSSGAESPALAYMSEEFSDIPFSTITLVTTIPSLMMIPASLAYSAIRRKVSVRPLFIIAMFLLIGGGVYPAFSSTFAQVCMGRAVFGIGCGIMWPLAQSIIIELYNGTKQNTLLGFNSVITSVGGIIWANLGGVLALSGWRHSFLTYLVPVGVLVFCA